MQVTVHSIQFKADVKLVDFVETKVTKLQQFYDHIIDGEVFLRLDKNDEAGNKVAEIKLSIPGKDLFARRQCKSFEEATDECVDALRRQIRKTKAKRMAVS